jgi:hypothetical protein
MTPTTGGTAGGISLTLTGTSFGVGGVVTVGGTTCPTQVLACRRALSTVRSRGTSDQQRHAHPLPAPARRGHAARGPRARRRGQQVRACIRFAACPHRLPGHRSNVLYFSYNAPTVFNVTPANGPSSGGSLVTVQGTNFGAPGAARAARS